jgi:predicted HTH transcriptional regulator
MDLQELITRGRFLFAGAPERLEVFESVDGRRSAKEIAQRVRRRATNVSRDLRKLRDGGLIEPKLYDLSQEQVTKEGSAVFQKVALARTVALRYFKQAGPAPGSDSIRAGRKSHGRTSKTKRPARRPPAAGVPTETALLDICRAGEDQVTEFKGIGTDVRKIVREVAAMANCSAGGRILCGVADDGTIEGFGLTRQQFDQPLQNAVRGNISPALTVKLSSVTAMGSIVLVVIVPPWNRRDVYHFEDRVLLRKGTNVFAARPEESRKLHAGRVVV